MSARVRTLCLYADRVPRALSGTAAKENIIVSAVDVLRLIVRFRCRRAQEVASGASEIFPCLKSLPEIYELAVKFSLTKFIVILINSDYTTKMNLR